MPTIGDLERATVAAVEMLAALNLGGDDGTAGRLVRALNEIGYARTLDPGRHLDVQFPPASDNPGLVVVQDVEFTSLCEHHMLPFSGVATVAYLPTPGQPIVGLSKMARLVQEFAARPQLQERLTDQIATTLHESVKARGAACAVRGVHTCMALRGARTGLTASMVTIHHVGVLADQPWRGDFDRRLSTRPWRESANA